MDQAVDSAMNEVIEVTTHKNTVNKPKQTTSEPPKTEINQNPNKPVEKTHFFHSASLEKNKNKIIFLNESAMDLVKPSLETSVVYFKNDVHKIFIVFLIFILAGEFFSAPAITLADSCTLHYLGPTRADLYGRQRMFGSLGWAVAMFSVGILLDQATAFTDHPCGKAGPDEDFRARCQ
jgi:hypothetical protein